MFDLLTIVALVILLAYELERSEVVSHKVQVGKILVTSYLKLASTKFYVQKPLDFICFVISWIKVYSSENVILIREKTSFDHTPVQEVAVMHSNTSCQPPAKSKRKAKL